jgi:hypothetical protein
MLLEHFLESRVFTFFGRRVVLHELPEGLELDVQKVGVILDRTDRRK